MQRLMRLGLVGHESTTDKEQGCPAIVIYFIKSMSVQYRIKVIYVIYAILTRRNLLKVNKCFLTFDIPGL